MQAARRNYSPVPDTLLLADSGDYEKAYTRWKVGVFLFFFIFFFCDAGRSDAVRHCAVAVSTFFVRSVFRGDVFRRVGMRWKVENFGALSCFIPSGDWDDIVNTEEERSQRCC